MEDGDVYDRETDPAYSFMMYNRRKGSGHGKGRGKRTNKGFGMRMSGTSNNTSVMDLAKILPSGNKIPPGFDGDINYFLYEIKVRDWEEITELAVEKRGPALRGRMHGQALVYVDDLQSNENRKALLEPTGVEFFLNYLRKKYLMPGAPLFLHRFLYLFKMNRGGESLINCNTASRCKKRG